jgi:hypothetical protein
MGDGYLRPEAVVLAVVAGMRRRSRAVIKESRLTADDLHIAAADAVDQLEPELIKPDPDWQRIAALAERIRQIAVAMTAGPSE